MSLHYVAEDAHGARRYLQALTGEWFADPVLATGFPERAEADRRVADLQTKYEAEANWCVYSVKRPASRRDSE